MSLSNAKALKLYHVITKRRYEEAILAQASAWQEWFSGETFPTQPETYLELQEKLLAIRKASLDRKSYICDNIRIYDPRITANVSADISDVFARGIDSARAVTEILRLATQSQETFEHKTVLTQMIALIETFHEKSRILNNIKDAKKELERFNGALASLLVSHNIVSKRKSANHAINFVRDYLWKKDICMPHCMVKFDHENMQLRYSEPMTFHEEINTKNPWIDELKNRMGGDDLHPWFDEFLAAHLNEFLTLSPTPMSRSTPNPANAFSCTDALISKEEVINLGHYTRMAITEPLDVKNAKIRQEMTNANHRQLISEQRLKEEMAFFMENWGHIYEEGDVITLPLLHQTLIGDEVSFSPDQRKAQISNNLESSLIESKLKANQALKNVLKQKRIFYNQIDGSVHICDAKATDLPQHTHEIKIALFQTNACINMWHDRARLRNNDIHDSRQLIRTAMDFFEKSRPQVALYQDELNTVIDFLNSADHSFFTPYKFKSDKVKRALETLTEALQNPKEDALPRATRENLALSLHAAVELKCSLHETWAGSFRRRVGNFSRDYFRNLPFTGHLLDWMLRGTMAISAFFVKRIINAIELVVFACKWPFVKTDPPQFIAHWEDRKVLFRAANEGLLAETLGILQGGCVSAADRAGEMAEQRAARRMYFSQESHFLSYHDSKEVKKAFFKKYGSTQFKHASVEQGTGSAGTADNETRGLFGAGLMAGEAETAEEQALAKLLSGLRKGKFNDEVDYNNYLGVKKTIPNFPWRIIPSYYQTRTSLTGEKEPSNTPRREEFLPY